MKEFAARFGRSVKLPKKKAGKPAATAASAPATAMVPQAKSKSKPERSAKPAAAGKRAAPKKA